jgi:hypothetical protein
MIYYFIVIDKYTTKYGKFKKKGEIYSWEKLKNPSNMLE